MWVKSSRQNTCLKMFRVGVLCWCIWEYLSISHCSVFLTHSAGKTSFPITFFLTASFSGFPSLVSPLVYFHYFLIWNKKGCFFFFLQMKSGHFDITVHLSWKGSCIQGSGAPIWALGSVLIQTPTVAKGKSNALIWRTLWFITTLTKSVEKHPTPQ